MKLETNADEPLVADFASHPGERQGPGAGGQGPGTGCGRAAAALKGHRGLEKKSRPPMNVD